MGAKFERGTPKPGGHPVVSNFAPGIAPLQGAVGRFAAVAQRADGGWWEGRFLAGEYIGERRLLAFPLSRPSLISGIDLYIANRQNLNFQYT